MQEYSEQIQLYHAETDASAVFLLWQTALGRLWPIAFERFQRVLAAPHAQHFVARNDGQIIGFVATSQSENWSTHAGHLLLLLVAPSWQRKGLGKALHETALLHLRSAGAQVIQLGGLVPRFWCGVPAKLEPAQAFFRAQGWEMDGTVYDLVQDLRQYTTPPAIYQRMVKEQITLAEGTEADTPEVLDFERREFFGWLQHYESCASLGDQRDFLIARDKDGRVVGTLLMYTPQSHPSRTDIIWRVMLGADAGAFGAVGVAPSEQGRGIGIALVAKASDVLKERGVKNCVIDWLVIPDFYAKAGYKKWRAYTVSKRTF